MITERQAAAFWRLLAAAARHQAVPDREAYRRRILREELGIEHMSQIGRTRDYDRVMHRLALEAEDWDALAHYGVAGDRRMAELVADCATQVLELFDAEDSSNTYPTFDRSLNYISGILRQSGMSPVRIEGNDYWLDLSPDDLRILLQILDTHRRRLLHRLGWTGSMAYAHGRRWIRTTAGALDCNDPALPRNAFRIRLAA